MESEFQALVDNHTWTLCPQPSNRNIIHNKWVYKIKQKPDGSIERYKTRLVAKWFEQRDGINYTETFSPVIKPATMRLLLTLAVHHNWPIKHIDIANAFLHGHLNEEVFMEQPKGFVDTHHPDFVCKLQKRFMVLNKLQELGFISSLKPFLSLALHDLFLIHLYLCCKENISAFLFLFMLMIL